MQAENNKERKENKRRIILKIIFMGFYSVFLIYLSFLLFSLNYNSIIVVLLFIFLFLLVLGPLLSGIKKGFSFKSSASKKRKSKTDYQLYKESIEKKAQSKKPSSLNEVNLNFKYKKPLIQKCQNCGMVLVSHLKVCPNCGEKLPR